MLQTSAISVCRLASIADPEAQDCDGNRPLQKACARGLLTLQPSTWVEAAATWCTSAWACTSRQSHHRGCTQTRGHRECDGELSGTSRMFQSLETVLAGESPAMRTGHARACSNLPSSSDIASDCMRAHGCGIRSSGDLLWNK
jgi:hypothetical protein